MARSGDGFIRPRGSLGPHRGGLILLGVFAISTGAAYWLLDALFDTLIYREAGFLRELLNPSTREYQIRWFVTIGISLFTFMFLRTKRAENTLRLFFDIVMGTGEGILVVNSVGRILFVNDVFAKGLGFSRKKLLQMNVTDFDASISKESFKVKWATLAETKTHETEYVHRTKSGAEIPVEIVSRYIKIGGTDLVIATVRDISSRRSQELLLKKILDQNDQAERMARFGSYEIDFSAKSTQWSKGMYALFEAPPEQGPLSTEASLSRIHLEDRERVRILFQEDLDLGRFHKSEHRLALPSGKVIWVECIAEFEKDASGRVKRVLGAIHDVTVRKDMEISLQEREEKIRLLLEFAGEGVLAVDTLGTCTFANPAALKLLGYTNATALVGKNLHQMIHHTKSDGTPYPGSECKAYRTLRDSVPVQVDDEVFWRSDGTSFDVEYVVRPLVRGGKTIGSVYAFFDISLRRQTERELHKTTEKLREANKLKDLFTDIMRHDLLNPASVAKTSSELLQKLETDSTKLRILETIHRSTNGLIELCENASRYAKTANTLEIEKGEYDLAILIRRVVRDFHTQLTKKNMELQLRFQGEIYANVNPMISEVFANLLSNAIKYCPEGTVICIGIKECSDSWLISVSDQGPGILDSDKTRVFTRFERLGKQGVKGSGLGLAIARQIVNLHNGEIWVTDKDDGSKGSVFWVRLEKKLKPALAPSFRSSMTVEPFQESAGPQSEYHPDH